jgi:hypothetical protein
MFNRKNLTAIGEFLDYTTNHPGGQWTMAYHVTMQPAMTAEVMDVIASKESYLAWVAAWRIEYRAMSKWEVPSSRQQRRAMMFLRTTMKEASILAKQVSQEMKVA